MQSFSVVLQQSDPQIAQSLASSLSDSFKLVQVNGSLGELRRSIARHRAGVAVLDMEEISLSDVEILSREFPGINIVCTHRLADEKLWAEALNAGAADVCPSNDTAAIVAATKRTMVTAVAARHSA